MKNTTKSPKDRRNNNEIVDKQELINYCQANKLDMKMVDVTFLTTNSADLNYTKYHESCHKSQQTLNLFPG
ncbi:hypothetical protein KSF78_0000921 [Schistosoma japonicum]|nr:hypothetical protein KSF78_0000921 [Schistosoma japonicum]